MGLRPNSLETPPAELMSQETQATPPLPEIPGYQLFEPVGRGGMSVVYRARHEELKRFVALKLLRHDQDQKALAKRMEIEAQAIAKLQHPNIAQVFHLGISEAGPFLALEYLDGGNLSERQQGPMDPREAARLILTLAEAVDYSHRQGVIHRDLKPSNILFDSEGHAKIADYGLAKLIEQDSQLTETGAVFGTPAYMAPEQASGVVRNVTGSCDLYSLGAVLYELLVGRPPFLADNPTQTILLLLSSEPVSPRRLQPKVPRDLETICLRCLRKKASKRYPTAAELADDLRRFIEGRPIQARRIGAVEKTLLWAQRRPVAAALAGISLLLFVTLIVSGAFYSASLREANQDIAVQKDRSDGLFHSSQELAHWVLFRHAIDLRSTPGTTAAREKLARRFQQYLDQLQEQAGDDRDLSEELAAAYEQLALIQGDPYHENVGRSKQALANYLAALKIRQNICQRDPQDTTARMNLVISLANVGAMYSVLGNLKQAESHYQLAMETLTGMERSTLLSRSRDQAEGSLWIRLGDLDRDRGDRKKALRKYQRARILLRNKDSRIQAGKPIDGLVIVNCRLAQLYADAPLIFKPAIEKQVLEFLESLETLVAQVDYNHLEDLIAARQMGQAMRIHADILRLKGQDSRARKRERLVLKLYRQLAQRDPGNATLKRDVSLSLTRVGSGYLALENYTTATKYFQESLAITRQLLKTDPRNLDLQKDLWVDYHDLGTAMMFQQKLESAEEYLNQSLLTAQRIARVHGKNDPLPVEESLPDRASLLRLAQSHERLGTLKSLTGNEIADSGKKRNCFLKSREQFARCLVFLKQAKKLEPLNGEEKETEQVVRGMIEKIDRFLDSNK